MEKRKTRKQKAGRFIKDGAYGCVFRPAIRCNSNNSREPNSISKVLDLDSAAIEYSVGQKVANIDSAQQYTLYPKRICKLNPKWSVRNNLYRCKHLKNRSKEIVQLIYADGGYDLQKVIERIKPMSLSIHMAFFKAFENILEGIKVLHDSNFVHMDLKPENIICSLKGSENSWFSKGQPKYSMRLIDFGLSNYIANIIKEDGEEFTNNYYVWPFELRLINSKYRKKQPRESDLNAYKLINMTSTGQPYWIADEYSSDAPTLDLYKDINNSINTGLDKEVLPEILKKTDIYSIGITLSYIYRFLTHHYMKDAYKIDHPPKDKTLHDTLSVPFYNLIKRMTEPDYKKRATIDDVISEYNGVFGPFFKDLA